MTVQTGREFDLVVFGATGFTGQLICEHLVERGVACGLRWAMAGRDAAKLAATRRAIGADQQASLVIADVTDAMSMALMAARSAMVIAAAGPYQLHGSAVVAACAAAGTDYLDLSGETAWMRRMIDAHAVAAERSGARILFSCGFDSVPFELGVMLLQETAIARCNAPIAHVHGRVLTMVGRFSGGTAASGRATREAARMDPSVATLLRDPFALVPGFSGPAQPAEEVAYDAALGVWTTPFVMAPINTRNVHRSNALQRHRWGTDFRYGEAMVVGAGAEGEAQALALAAINPLGDDARLAPGEGPSQAERDAGWYDLLFCGTARDGQEIRVAVSGDRDPGYGSTSRIIVETALCLRDKRDLQRAGIWTPGSFLGLELINRLDRKAGVTFRVTGGYS